MNPIARPTSGSDAPQAASWAFTETFVPESPAAEVARRAANDLGVSAVSQGAGAALTFLTKVLNARAVVEIGTGAGVSSLALFAGMAADGILTSIDLEAEHQNSARRTIMSTGIKPQRLRTIAGAALGVLPKLSDGAYDLVLIDGDPLEYAEYVEESLRLLRHGGVLVLHHALWHGKTADEENADDEPVILREALQAIAETEELTSVLLPVGDGLLVAVKA